MSIRQPFVQPHNRAVLRLAAVGVLLALLPAGCVRHRQPVERDWSAEVRQLENRYAPDARLAVFRVTVSTEAGKTVVTGEVDNTEARRELLDRISNSGTLPVVDRITVLPDASLAGKDRAIVNVAVGNIRAHPEHSAELVTQVLLGQTLRVLKAERGWLYVQCSDRYLGWIDDDALLQTDRDGCRQWDAADRLIVTGQYGLLRERAQKTSLPVSDLSLGDILRRKSVRGAWVEAALPDGRVGFVEREAVEPYQAWQSSRRATPETIETAARMFVGVPYLWGGTSARGFDCSGFVKTVFMLNGLALLRDAGQQARAGRDVDPGQNFANLRRGDLLFFGRRETAEKPERIWHVAIYLRARNFIHCSGRVRISSLDPASPQYDEGHARNFVRARRLIDASPEP